VEVVALKEIRISEGDCKYITAPSMVFVFVGGKQCVCTMINLLIKRGSD
jgi:hypothetical protein